MAFKHIHLTSVVLTIVFFIVRGIWMMMDSPKLQKKWVRIVPHIIDTVLLASAIGLVITIHQYPFVHGWVTAKLLGVVVYIVLGTIALKSGKTKGARVVAFVAALATLFYIISVAFSKSVLPFG